MCNCKQTVRVLMRLYPGFHLEHMAMRVTDDSEMNNIGGEFDGSELHLRDNPVHVSIVVKDFKFCPFCGKSSTTTENQSWKIHKVALCHQDLPEADLTIVPRAFSFVQIFKVHLLSAELQSPSLFKGRWIAKRDGRVEVSLLNKLQPPPPLRADSSLKRRRGSADYLLLNLAKCAKALLASAIRCTSSLFFIATPVLL